MDRDQYTAAFHALATAHGFTRRAPLDYAIPGGGVLRPWHASVALTRDSWCYECEWRVIGAERASYAALAALVKACEALPKRFGHGTMTDLHAPGPTGFGSGDITDTSRT